MTCLFLMTTRLKPLAALLPALFTMVPAGAQPFSGVGTGVEGGQPLPSITIYASRFEEKLADALPQTSIVTAAEIQKSGANNVSEVLSKVAGLPVKLNLDGSTNAVVDIKGFGDTASNNIVVLLDGVRLSEHEQTMARTSMIPVEAIDHIEITKAGNSVLYGDGANGGTINIITRKNVGNLTVVTAGVASYAGYQSGLYHSQALQDSELSLFARQYASDNYRKNAKGTELSAGTHWVKHLDAQTDFGARFFANRERNKLPGALPSVWLNSTPRETQVPGYNWDAAVDSHSLTLFGKKTIHDVELAIDWNKRSRRNSDDYSYDAYNVYAGYHYDDWRRSYSNSSSQTDVQSISPRIKVSNFIVSRNTLQMGYDWLKTTKDGQAFLTFGCSSGSSTSLCGNGGADAGGNTYQIVHRSSGLYFRDVWDVSSTDRMVLGYRRESYSQNRAIDYGYGPSAFSATGTTHANELEYVRTFQPHMTGYLRLSRNFRIPNADDNSNVASAPPNYDPVLLRVQTSQDLDVGLNYQSGSVSTETSYFHSRVKNEIGFDPSGCGYACNVNYDPTKRDGVNFKQKWTLSKVWALRANLQYVNARFVEGPYTGKTIPGVAALSGNLSLDHRLSPQDQLTLTTRWAESRHMSGDFGNSQSKTPGYMVADLSYFYRMNNWSLVASLMNLTDKKYTDAGIYKSSYTSPYKLTVYPNPGRSFSLSGRYVF